MNDFLTDFLIYSHGKLGGSSLFFVCGFAFFGMTYMIFFLERNTNRYKKYYRDTKDIPYPKNFSTLIDFAILNPFLLTIIAWTTAAMHKLPVLLAPKVLKNNDEVEALGAQYRNLMDGKFLSPIVIFIVIIVWILYIRKYFGRSSWRKAMSKVPFTEIYIGVATTIGMYFIAVFIWRIGALLWYLSRITQSGFVIDSLEWSIGVNDIANVLSGVNGFLLSLRLSLLCLGYMITSSFLESILLGVLALRGFLFLWD